MELKVLGQEQVGKFEFTGIEGGFGEGKKAMLISDIAKIHDTAVKKLNQTINRNRKQFVDDLDIIDLKQVNNFAVTLSDLGFSQNQINASKHIYLLSERGYLKLLKIMDDDKAWDIYNDIVDNYFNMRVAIKEKKPEIVEPSRLAIMNENAQTRKAKVLLKLVETAPDEVSRNKAWGKAYEAISGEPYLEQMTKEEFSATQIAKKYGVTKQRIGMIQSKLHLKAEKPNSNEYGRWIKEPAKNGKTVDNWRYYKPALKVFHDYLKENKLGIYKEDK